MQEANHLHHVQTNLHPQPEIEADLQSIMKISGEAWHDEQDDYVRAIGVVVINQSTNQIHNTIILWEGPVCVGGGGGGGGNVKLIF